MAKLKKLGLIDMVEIHKMMSMVASGDFPSFSELLLLSPFIFFQSFLPLKMRKLPESFVSRENKVLNGMISVQSAPGNPYKWNIKNLFLAKNSFAAGRQLVDYVLARFGAMGANTFRVTVSDSNEELLDLFSKGCGFRLCSHESLWKMNEYVISKTPTNGDFFRPFRNADAKEVCELYNDAIFPHFRYSLARVKQEFYDVFFQGLSKTSYFKYLLCDAKTKRIKGIIQFQTEDNENFFLDIVLPAPYEENYPDALNFSISQISRRKKKFNLFIQNRKYMMTSKKYEEFLKEHNFSCLQNNVVLVKDFFKTIKQEEKIIKPAIAFSEIKGKPAFDAVEEKSCKIHS
ncbi:MAG: hypothetical protein PHV37_02220 [Candidatus Gastranaerophilales bacterium]|nr:hypothetical protein [Candidatus Gastranaerophilales bacterium]